MKRSLSPWLALAVLMTPLPLRAQANDKGLAHLVPDLILDGDHPAGRRGSGISTCRTFHTRQSDVWRFAGSLAARYSGHQSCRSIRRQAEDAVREFSAGIIDRRLHVQLQRTVGALHAQHRELWSGIHRTRGDDRPKEIQSRRQLSAHELRYLRRPGSAGRIDRLLSSAHRLLLTRRRHLQALRRPGSKAT